MRALEIRGVRVLNGSAAFALELSKTAQAALLRELDIPAPRTWTFNDLSALRERTDEIAFPVLLKPEQGGSGARIVMVETYAQLEALLA
jgi:glutathione synthase/RimK-type ligase-like ATP-grasp enzyme